MEDFHLFLAASNAGGVVLFLTACYAGGLVLFLAACDAGVVVGDLGPVEAGSTLLRMTLEDIREVEEIRK